VTIHRSAAVVMRRSPFCCSSPGVERGGGEERDRRPAQSSRAKNEESRTVRMNQSFFSFERAVVSPLGRARILAQRGKRRRQAVPSGSPPRARVSPRKSSTVTVSAEWPRLLSRDGTFSAKWMQTPALWLVPKLSPSSAIEPRTPNAVQRERINQIIYDELVRAQFLPTSREYFQQVIRDLASDGCDAVALACTEIPLLIDETTSPLPILDSTRILARAALRAAAQ